MKGKKLSDPSTSHKCYWTLLKTLVNGRKTPCIPPLFRGNKFILHFKEKSEIFNSFFAKQCLLIDWNTLPFTLSLITEKSLSDVEFSVEDIKNIFSKPDSNKGHGDDMISICIPKLCNKSIFKPLSFILNG